MTRRVMIHRNGFSLIELLMVMLLISIMVGIVAPVLQPQKFQMDGAIVQMASTLNASQRAAILRQHDVVLAVDSVNNLVRLHFDSDNDGTLESGEEFRVVELGNGATFGRGPAPARPLGGNMNTFPDTQGGMPALIFSRNGSASAESILYLTSTRSQASGGAFFPEDTRAIEIERATGRVRCYSYANGSWAQTC